MKHKEIKKGNNVTKSHCAGDGTLQCAPVSSIGDCDKPHNLAYCTDASNLKTKAAGSLCCGGGDLTVVASSAGGGVSGGSCGNGTNLCNQEGATLQHHTHTNAKKGA